MDVDAQMGAVERDAVEHRLQRFRRRRQPVAEGIRRALEDQRKPGRALVEIVAGLARWRAPDRDRRRAARRPTAGRAARRGSSCASGRAASSGSMAMPSSVRETSVVVDRPPRLCAFSTSASHCSRSAAGNSTPSSAFCRTHPLPCNRPAAAQPGTLRRAGAMPQSEMPTARQCRPAAQLALCHCDAATAQL